MNQVCRLDLQQNKKAIEYNIIIFLSNKGDEYKSQNKNEQGQILYKVDNAPMANNSIRASTVIPHNPSQQLMLDLSDINKNSNTVVEIHIVTDLESSTSIDSTNELLLQTQNTPLPKMPDKKANIEAYYQDLIKAIVETSKIIIKVPETVTVKVSDYSTASLSFNLKDAKGASVNLVSVSNRDHNAKTRLRSALDRAANYVTTATNTGDLKDTFRKPFTALHASLGDKNNVNFAKDNTKVYGFLADKDHQPSVSVNSSKNPTICYSNVLKTSMSCKQELSLLLTVGKNIAPRFSSFSSNDLESASGSHGNVADNSGAINAILDHMHSSLDPRIGDTIIDKLCRLAVLIEERKEKAFAITHANSNRLKKTYNQFFDTNNPLQTVQNRKELYEPRPKITLAASQSGKAPQPTKLTITSSSHIDMNKAQIKSLYNKLRPA